MDWGQAFKIANTVALLCWVCLMLLPRFPVMVMTIQRWIIGGLCLVYSVVVMLFFFRVEGGGFNSLEQVKTLFSSDAVVFAGWVHYLAFDLFIGIWIATRASALGVHRVLQVPILFATFMFGPFGLLLFYFVEGGLKLAGKKGIGESVEGA